MAVLHGIGNTRIGTDRFFPGGNQRIRSGSVFPLAEDERSEALSREIIRQGGAMARTEPYVDGNR